MKHFDKFGITPGRFTSSGVAVANVKRIYWSDKKSSDGAKKQSSLGQSRRNFRTKMSKKREMCMRVELISSVRVVLVSFKANTLTGNALF
jgi:hypothetical protein